MRANDPRRRPTGMNIDEQGTHFSMGEYDVEIIVHGLPGKCGCHGSLGFGTRANALAMSGKTSVAKRSM